MGFGWTRQRGRESMRNAPSSGVTGLETKVTSRRYSREPIVNATYVICEGSELTLQVVCGD